MLLQNADKAARLEDIPTIEAQIPPDIDAEANQEEYHANNNPEVPVIDKPQIKRIAWMDNHRID